LKLKNLPLKLERAAFSSAYRLLNLRPSSSPYLSGDGFRMLCSHFYEGETRHSFEPLAVKQDELVLEVGDADTVEAFTENLRGMTPGEEKEFQHFEGAFGWREWEQNERN